MEARPLSVFDRLRLRRGEGFMHVGAFADLDEGSRLEKLSRGVGEGPVPSPWVAGLLERYAPADPAARRGF